MSTPVREPEGPLNYAPRWARAQGGAGGSRPETAIDGNAARSLVPVRELAPARDVPPPRIAMPPRDSVPAREPVAVRDSAPVRKSTSVRSPVTPRQATAAPVSATVEATATAQDAAAELPWKRKKRPPIFEGDVAIKELRARLALAPDQMPEPPLYRASDPIFAVVARLTGVMVLAAVGALGFLWIMAPHASPPENPIVGQSNDELALASYRTSEVSQPLRTSESTSEGAKAERVPETLASRASWSAVDYARDVTDGAAPAPADLAPRAAVSASRPAAPPTRSVALAVPTGPVTDPSVSTPRSAAPQISVPQISAPQVSAPQVSAPQVSAPPIFAPPVFAPRVSAPQVAPARLPAPVTEAPTVVSAAPPSIGSGPDHDEVAALLVRARAYISAGDVAAARLVLRRAAEHADSQAALALGGTYDPIVLKRLGVINFHADTAQARDWYRRAAELGSTDAPLRLEQLAQIDR